MCPGFDYTLKAGNVLTLTIISLNLDSSASPTAKC